MKYESTPVLQYCCDEMRKAHAAKAIVFPAALDINISWIFGIYDGRSRKQFEIKYCPFCGVPITFEK